VGFAGQGAPPQAKCKAAESRAAAFQTLSNLCKDSQANLQELVNLLIQTHVDSRKVREELYLMIIPIISASM
jgi:hypothetical protein